MRRTKNRVKLQNKLHGQLDAWGKRLEVSSVRSEPRTRTGPRRFHYRLIWAVGKGGRTILIYPVLNHQETIPRAICEEMEAAHLRGAAVGTARNIGEVWDIAIMDEKEYPRGQMTWLWLKRLGELRKQGEKDGRTEKE